MESFRYIYAPVLLNARSILENEQQVVESNIKNGSHSKVGAGVEISSDHRREFHKDYGETELDCRL